MKHLNEALYKLFKNTKNKGNLDQDGSQKFHGVSNGNVLTFKIQDGPIKEVGINGLQATDLLFFCKELFHSLNKSFPCRENALTITKIEEAIHWQDARTKDRESRGVEGRNKN